MRTLIENGKQYAVIPMVDYEKLREAAESSASDEALFDRAAARGEEAFPIALFDAIAAGAHPVRAFREYREMSQAALAGAARLSVPYLSQLEHGQRKGTTKTLRAIAEALHVPLVELIPG